MAKRRGLCHSDFFLSQLIDRADRKLFKQIQLSHRCPNSVLPSSRLPYSRYSLVSRGHQFSLPELNTVLCKNRPMFVIDVCISTFSSVIPPHCIVFFLLIILFFFSLLYSGFSSSLFVLKVRMSPLFIKGYLTT